MDRCNIRHLGSRDIRVYEPFRSPRLKANLRQVESLSPSSWTLVSRVGVYFQHMVQEILVIFITSVGSLLCVCTCIYVYAYAGLCVCVCMCRVRMYARVCVCARA